MKNIEELYEASKEDLPELYCDMDQVLCNFLKAADKAVSGSFATYDKKTRWDYIVKEKGFWENL